MTVPDPCRTCSPELDETNCKPGRERVGDNAAGRAEPARSASRLADRDVVGHGERVGDEIPDVHGLRRDGLREREVGDGSDADGRARGVVGRVGVERRGSRRVAVFVGAVLAAPAPTLTTRLMTTGVSPAGTVPTVHVIAVVPVQLAGTGATSVIPAGSVSVTAIPVASLGPVLVTISAIDERVADGERVGHRRRTVAQERALGDRDVGDRADQLVEGRRCCSTDPDRPCSS